jgi:hypothetical protein
VHSAGSSNSSCLDLVIGDKIPELLCGMYGSKTNVHARLIVLRSTFDRLLIGAGQNVPNRINQSATGIRGVRSAMFNRVRLKEWTNGHFQSRLRHRFHGFTLGKKPSVCWRSPRRPHRCIVVHFSVAHLFKLRLEFASKRYRNRP